MASRSETMSRRQLIAMAAGGLAAVAGVTIWRSGAFRSGAIRHRLLHVRGQAPQAWLQQLPAPWQARPVATMEALLAEVRQPGAADLAMIGEGWLPQLGNGLAPFAEAELFEDLLPVARQPAVLGVASAPAGEAGSGEEQPLPLALPWAFGSWVMVFRRQEAWAARARREGWSLLASGELSDEWLLPASPRVVMALVLQSLQAEANHPDPGAVPGFGERLAVVVRQAKGFDSRHGMTQVVNGKAAAAVVPSWAVLPRLSHDHRLRVVRPATSPPLLSWRLLVRPRQAAAAPRQWLQAARRGLVLGNLLQAGYCPPLPATALQPQLGRAVAADLLHPGDDLLATAETLQPFSEVQQRQYQALWNTAMGERT